MDDGTRFVSGHARGRLDLVGPGRHRQHVEGSVLRVRVEGVTRLAVVLVLAVALGVERLPRRHAPLITRHHGGSGVALILLVILWQPLLHGLVGFRLRAIPLNRLHGDHENLVGR